MSVTEGCSLFHSAVWGVPISHKLFRPKPLPAAAKSCGL